MFIKVDNGENLDFEVLRTHPNGFKVDHFEYSFGNETFSIFDQGTLDTACRHAHYLQHVVCDPSVKFGVPLVGAIFLFGDFSDANTATNSTIPVMADAIPALCFMGASHQAVTIQVSHLSIPIP